MNCPFQIYWINILLFVSLGGGGKNGKSFNKIMLNIEKKFSTIRVVNDQTDIPIYILDLSVLLVNMAEKEQ